MLAPSRVSLVFLFPPTSWSSERHRPAHGIAMFAAMPTVPRASVRLIARSDMGVFSDAACESSRKDVIGEDDMRASFMAMASTQL